MFVHQSSVAMLLWLAGLLIVRVGAIDLYDLQGECALGLVIVYGAFTYPGIGYPSTYPMLCQNPVAVVSLYAAMAVYCDDAQTAAGLPKLELQCTEYAEVGMLSAEAVAANLTPEAIATLPVYGQADLEPGSNVTEAFLPDQAWYEISYKSSYNFDYEENHHAYYTYALYGFWGAILLFGMAQNAVRQMAERRRGHGRADLGGSQGRPATARPGLVGRVAALADKHFVTPSLLPPFHQRRLLGCTIPTRAVGFVIAAYWIVNFILSCLHYRVFAGDYYFATVALQMWRYIGDRTGYMSYGNLPLLWMFSGRNNVFLWLTGWSFTTFNLFHRHIARIATVQAIIHSIAYTVIYCAPDGGYREAYDEFWFTAGVIATVVMSFAVLFSFSVFRAKLYESFLLVHIVLSALLLVFLWYHTNIFALNNFNYPLLLPPVVIWAFDRFLRLMRQLYCNVHVRRVRGSGRLQHTRTTVSFSAAANILTVDVVPGNAGLSAGPGQHYYLYQPLRLLGWENHPFTLSYWSPPDGSSADSDAHLCFYIRPYDGWTKTLRQACVAADGTIPTSASGPAMFIEGPYGLAEPLHTFEHVLLVAGGSGIACMLPYLQDHVTRVASRKTVTQHITLVWADRTEAFIRLVADGPLARILGRDDVDFDVYQTGAAAVSSTSTHSSRGTSTEAVDPEKSGAGGGVLSRDESLPSPGASTPTKRTAISIHAGRPDVESYVCRTSAALQDTDARLAVMVCGPAQLSDSVRAVVAQCMDKRRRSIEYFEETFGCPDGGGGGAAGGGGMQVARAKAEAQGRKAKLTSSYQELLDEFANKDLKSVGNYTLGRLIGKGSFGKVYLASHKLTNGSKVVLKSAKKEDSNLAREIHHHRQFVHPHIARLYEVIVTESMVWMVLEYCQGDELYNHLLKHGRLPVEKVQKIFTQLVGAVSYVHQRSCVHRDLKLENILLDKHENVKLVDFGFTREYEGKANYLQTFCGTICYSAPEMLKGEKYAGEKVDVWSLGIILYALLCGELPFDDDDDDVTRRRILTEEPVYQEQLIPPDALALIRLMLSKRPLIRPSLPDILSHAFLAEHAPQQQAMLKLQRPAPFSTGLEKETLGRMRSAGVDIDSVIESVLAQRCDALAGWWALLIEKEQRKEARRERKRKEKEQERRSSRRLSGASSRLERLATVGEEGGGGGLGLGPGIVFLGDPPTPKSARGRSQRRSGAYELRIEDFPGLKELGQLNDVSLEHQPQQRPSQPPQTPQPQPPPTPVDKDSVRSASSSRHRRPIPPPKEGILRSARSRGSTLHLVTTTDALEAVKAAQGGGGGGGGGGSGGGAGSSRHGHDGDDDELDEDGQPRDRKVRKKTSQVIITHWKNMTHWIVESARRNKGPGRRGGGHSMPNLVSKPGSVGKDGKESKDGRGDSSPRPQTSKYPHSSSAGMTASNTASLPRSMIANGFGGRGGSRGGSSGGGPGGGSGGGGGGGGGSSGGIGCGGCGVGGGNDGSAATGSGGASLSTMLDASGSANGNTNNASGNANARNSSSQRYNNIGGQTGAIYNSNGQPPRLQTTTTMTTSGSSGSYNRQSLSPSPLTPRSTVRRPSAANHGLRGRKSTSSSVSSIRSIHHHHQHSHSKASSTSSNGSVSTVMSKTPLPAGRSPHHSVKVLPATPTMTSFPSNLRLVRGSMGGGGGGRSSLGHFNEGMPMGRPPSSPNPFSFGSSSSGGGTPVMFAKRKRNIFKGPMLAFGGGSSAGGGGSGGGLGGAGIGISSGVRISGGIGSSIGLGLAAAGGGSHSRSASASGLARLSGEITIAEEDEEDGDLDGLDDGEGDGVEEVDVFTPVVQRPGELVEEIYEDDEEERTL
ncbi:serine/threonine-protein kinase [Grosmannia clavigera kw1407]|uniref:Serine/threonine-protein kinase n=1 Tax=Grosmannia clavigera (strain kw1407 / UAMH 11150) TaxID=655863 RepID=F0XQR5_GROCL|nr:serine/threonine-protein kinase [Grosmannia clavigera kw1407]EFW99861.1 serine/threonine-protein kinase [Grosmannia clavigera kw1407]